MKKATQEALAALDKLPAGQGEMIVEQIGEARRHLRAAPVKPVRFIQPSLHGIARSLSPGQLWMVMAQSGIGKTTFALSVINDWVEAGTKVCLVPTELEDWEVRRDIACLRAGVHKSIAIEHSWDEYENGDAMLKRVDEEIRRQAIPPFSDHLMVLSYRELDEIAVLDSGRAAAEFGAQVLVVDHFDHLDYGGKAANAFGATGRIARAAKAAAEEHEIAVLGMKQVNTEAAKGDVLNRYLPPQLHQMQGGGLNHQNAVVVLGLYRPLKPVETEDDLARLKGVRARLIDPSVVLMPNALGVVVLKHRPDGRLENRKCILTLNNGRLIERVHESERYG